jgi:hypothetical protein
LQMHICSHSVLVVLVRSLFCQDGFVKAKRQLCSGVAIDQTFSALPAAGPQTAAAAAALQHCHPAVTLPTAADPLKGSRQA